MLNICIVFAQLERETIQKRVTDAYYSRSQRGFKMGGKAPYGFHTEPIKMDGINTKKLVVNPEEAANIRLMFEMYAQPTTFLRGHYPVLCRTGDFVPWQRADTPPRWRRCYAILSMCRQTLMCTNFSKVKVQSLSMTLPILRA